MLLFFSPFWQLKEFQQKSSPVSVGGEKGGVVTGAKKKRKVKGNQLDAPSEDRRSPDNVNVSQSLFILRL